MILGLLADAVDDVARRVTKREPSELRELGAEWLKQELRSFQNSWRMARQKNYHYFACVFSGGHKYERQGERQWIARGTWMEMEAPSLWICKRCDAMAIG